jgi:hypothetical protein
MAVSAKLRKALEMIAAERPNFSAGCRILVQQVVQEYGLPDAFWFLSSQSAADRLLADILKDWPIADVADFFSLARSSPVGVGLYWDLVCWLRSDDERKVYVALLNRVVGSIHNAQIFFDIARRFPQLRCECDVMIDECERVWRQFKPPRQLREWQRRTKNGKGINGPLQ